MIKMGKNEKDVQLNECPHKLRANPHATGPYAPNQGAIGKHLENT